MSNQSGGTQAPWAYHVGAGPRCALMRHRAVAVAGLFLATLWTLAGVASAEAATYCVAPGGSDSGPGTELEPWGTLTASLPKLAPGDTLLVRDGTYVERVVRVPIHEGTASQPITVRAYTGERPVLQGLLWLNRPSYWVIDGLNVTWDDATGNRREHMVKVTDGVGWTIRNAEIWGAKSFAAVLVATGTPGEPRNWRITGCAIHDTNPTHRINQDHLIYVNSGGHPNNGRIERNLLYNAPNGEAVKLGPPTALEPGPAGVRIRYNTIYHTSQAVLVADSAWGNVIERNIVVDVIGTNPAFRSYMLTGRFNVARNNLVYSAARVFMGDAGYGELEDGGGNVTGLDPELEPPVPHGLRARSPAAWKYGRYGQ